MTKKLALLLAFIISGCGANTEIGSEAAPPINHNFQVDNRDWRLTLPADWEVLEPETQVPFLARKGSENIAILERDVTNTDPVEQIIKSAESQFFAFQLNNQDANQWEFTGQPGPTNTPRTFWQKIIPIQNTRKFLLGSCSQIAESPMGSECAAILNSWGDVTVEEEA
jgi:hypothetical protein